MVSPQIKFSNIDPSLGGDYRLCCFHLKDHVLLGYWFGTTLFKVDYVPHDQFSDLTELKEDGEIQINMVSSMIPFIHVDYNSFEPMHFDNYFKDYKHLIPPQSSPSYEKLKQQKVFTLSYFQDLSKTGVQRDKINQHHVSTAMANSCVDSEDQMLLMFMDSHLNILLHKDRGFRYYNIYSCSTPLDYLYYILHVSKEFGVDLDKMKIQAGGELDEQSKLYTTLKSYLPKLRFYHSGKYTVSGNKEPFHYYLPLIIARSCAS